MHDHQPRPPRRHPWHHPSAAVLPDDCGGRRGCGVARLVHPSCDPLLPAPRRSVQPLEMSLRHLRRLGAIRLPWTTPPFTSAIGRVKTPRWVPPGDCCPAVHAVTQMPHTRQEPPTSQSSGENVYSLKAAAGVVEKIASGNAAGQSHCPTCRCLPSTLQVRQAAGKDCVRTCPHRHSHHIHNHHAQSLSVKEGPIAYGLCYATNCYRRDYLQVHRVAWDG